MNKPKPRGGLEPALALYRPRVTAFIAKMIQSDIDVEDLTQETMIKVSRGWEKFRGDSALSSWIFQIASNVCVDYFRYSSLRPGLAKEQITAQTPSSDGVVSHIQSKEIRSCIHVNIATLPETYQRILIMYYMDGASLKQIASAVGISANSAKVRLHRARKRFRDACFSACDISIEAGGSVVCGPKAGKRGQGGLAGQPKRQ